MNDEVERLAFLTGDNLLLKMVDVIIRLPPLYTMDYILLHNLGVWTNPTLQHPVTSLSNETNPVNITEQISNSTDLYDTFSLLYGGNPMLLLVPHMLRFCLCSTLYMISMLVFLLPTESLVTFYRYLACITVIPASYAGHKLMADSIQGGSWLSSTMLAQYLDYKWPLLGLNLDSQFSRAVAMNYLLQSSLALTLKRLLKVSGQLTHSTREYLSAVMILPCVLAMLSVPSSWLAFSAFAANILPAALLGTSLGQQAGTVYSSLVTMYNNKRDFINNFGLNTFIETEWGRLRVPTVLRTFWLSRLVLMLLVHQPINPAMSLTSLFTCVKTVLVKGSETFISVLGMTSIVSSLSHWFGVVFQIILKTEDDEEKSVASVSAVLFFVLALQTGLTGMDSEKRFNQICKNLCLLLTSILHFIHSMAQPVLMSLSASRSSNRSSHLRALSICLFLVLAPSVLVYALWLNFKAGTWLLAVTAFCVEVVVKVFVTITIYALFMWDAHCQDGLWESLDDWVYYIRAFGNTVEFCFAVFLFFNGGWILLFESGGTIRAVMMLIHAYFNIWCEARNGWSTFMKRRTAVAKIDSLNDATKEEIEKHNDVCAICYQEMSVAKLTKCKHMFHAICLRKWLYMQDNCPMCHEKLYQSDATSQTEEVVENLPGEIVPEDAEENAHIPNGLEDINQNYLDEDSDDYIDLTDSELDDLEQ
eukprot:GFUD01070322.1.p1 GENE.GFUD01070322.1~~GFUD01070322.1.p1  ORF type:complete len:702 (+),score=207.23 GFUD01070322.1:123-2228(+)